MNEHRVALAEGDEVEVPPDREKRFDNALVPWYVQEWDLPGGAVLVYCVGDVPGGNRWRLRVEEHEMLLPPQAFVAFLATVAQERRLRAEREALQLAAEQLAQLAGTMGVEAGEPLQEAVCRLVAQEGLCQEALRLLDRPLPGIGVLGWRWLRTRDLIHWHCALGRVLRQACGLA